MAYYGEFCLSFLLMLRFGAFFSVVKCFFPKGFSGDSRD